MNVSTCKEDKEKTNQEKTEDHRQTSKSLSIQSITAHLDHRSIHTNPVPFWQPTETETGPSFVTKAKLRADSDIENEKVRPQATKVDN